MAFNFNGNSLPSYIKVNSINQSILPPVSQNTMVVNGKSGAYDFGNEIGSRSIEMTVTVLGDSQTDLRTKIRELAELLYTEEAEKLILDDESDKYYMAKISGDSDIEEILKVGQGEITFICDDPYAYSNTESSGSFISEGRYRCQNDGGSEAYPLIDFKVDYDSSELTISLEEDPSKKLEFGTPSQVDLPTFNPEPIILNDNMSTTTGWLSAIEVDNGTIQGSFTSNGYSVFVGDWGDTGAVSGWFGASGLQYIGKELGDFRAEAIFGLDPSTVGQLGRVEIYLLDINKNQIAKQSLRIGSPRYVHPFAQLRVGSQYVLGQVEWEDVVGTYGSYKGVWDNWQEGKMAVARRGNVWSCYFTKTVNGVDTAQLSDVFTLNTEISQRDVAYIQIHIGTNTYGGHDPVDTMYITNIQVKELNVDPVTAKIPYCVEADDIITLDMNKGMVLKNGTPFYEYLDPHSQFFGLPKGQSHIKFHPFSVSNDESITFRERWL